MKCKIKNCQKYAKNDGRCNSHQLGENRTAGQKRRERARWTRVSTPSAENPFERKDPEAREMAAAKFGNEWLAKLKAVA